MSLVKEGPQGDIRPFTWALATESRDLKWSDVYCCANSAAIVPSEQQIGHVTSVRDVTLIVPIYDLRIFWIVRCIVI